MKKLSFTFAALLALAFSAAAQDTIIMNGLQRPNYMYYGNYNHFNNVHMSYTPGCEQGGDYCKYFYTNEELTIYGIAIGIKDGAEFFAHAGCDPCLAIHDTSHSHAHEYLRIYEPYPDSLHWTHQIMLNLQSDPVAYYARYIDTNHPNDPPKYAAMYERYFRTPVNVVDSFYVGKTCLNSIPYEEDESYWQNTYIPLMLATLSNYSMQDYDRIAYYGPISNRWIKIDKYGLFYLVFPILLPPDSNYVWDTTVVAGDTTIVSSDTTMVGDTLIVSDTTIVCDTLIIGYDTIIRYDTIVYYDTILGIEDHSLLQRLTGVMPNPAAKTAKVVSSFGMTLVEVYNMAGEKVHTLRLPDAPLTATLDVGRWPSGAYILRIHTPQGIAVKKLAVRH